MEVKVKETVILQGFEEETRVRWALFLVQRPRLCFP